MSHSNQTILEDTLSNIGQAKIDLARLHNQLHSGDISGQNAAVEVQDISANVSSTLTAIETVIKNYETAPTAEQDALDAARYRSCRTIMFNEKEAFGMTIADGTTNEEFDAIIDTVVADVNTQPN